MITHCTINGELCGWNECQKYESVTVLKKEKKPFPMESIWMLAFRHFGLIIQPSIYPSSPSLLLISNYINNWTYYIKNDYFFSKQQQQQQLELELELGGEYSHFFAKAVLRIC